MNTYYLKLQDQDISDENISRLLFRDAVLRDKSCKQLAKALSYEFKSDDYELRYVKSMGMFTLRFVYNRKNRIIVVTYHIIP